MLVLQRIAGLRRLELQLRRLVKEDTIRCANISHHSSVSEDKQGEIRRSFILKDKLLFRKVPVALSFLERSLLSHARHENSFTGAPTLGRGDTLPDGLIGMSQTVPQSSGSNVLVYPVKDEAELREGAAPTSSNALSRQERIISRPACMLRLLCALHFVEQERRKLYRHHMDRLESRLREAEKAAAAVYKQRESASTRMTARQAVLDAKADVMLLQSSLLSRPYVSARLWRFMLREEIWLAAIQESRKINADVCMAPPVIEMLLSITRLSFGALRDFVKGHSLNTRAPRFVASLPSLKVRRRKKKGSVGADDEKHEQGQSSVLESAATIIGGEDSMMMMMLPAASSTQMVGSAKSPTSQRTAGEKTSETIFADGGRATAPSLRWLPPASCDVVPLVLETLAMCSHVLPSLNTTDIVTNCGQAQEFFELLSVLQAMASSVLGISAHEGSDNFVTHQTLRLLEDAMLNCGENAKRALVAEGADVFSSLSSVKAARLLLGLESMKLLQMEEHASHMLITQLVMRIFPQLRTGTQRALLEKSRQNSLFAFATRSQRTKLYSEHGRHGMEAALLSSVRARARLQQRQMQAALRVKYIEEINGRSVGQIAENLPIYSLIKLFDLLVRAARDSPQQGPEMQGRLITAALFVVEGVLVATARASSNSDTVLQPDDLPSLLVSLSVLWPMVMVRYQMMRQSFTDQHQNSHLQKRKVVNDSMAKSEFVMVSYVTDMVFTAVNAAMAERVQKVESTLGTDGGLKPVQTISVGDILDIVTALFEWCNISLNNKSTAYVEATARLIKRLLVVDVQLWQELRMSGELRRDQFVRTVTDIFRRLNMMDAAVSQVLSTIC